MKTLNFWIVLMFLGGLYNTSMGQKHNSTTSKQSNNIHSTDYDPFDFYLGNWICYSKESALASYLQVSGVNSKDGIWEKFEHKNHTITYSIFYKDATTGIWTMSTVGPGTSNYQISGTRQLSDKSSSRTFYFEGTVRIKGKAYKDRIVIDYVNINTIIRTYEISTDNGLSYDVENRLNFKRIQS